MTTVDAQAQAFDQRKAERNLQAVEFANALTSTGITGVRVNCDNSECLCQMGGYR